MVCSSWAGVSLVGILASVATRAASIMLPSGSSIMPTLPVYSGLSRSFHDAGGVGNDGRIVHHRPRAPGEGHAIELAVDIEIGVVAEQRNHLLEIGNARRVDRLDEVELREQRDVAHVGRDDVDLADAARAQLGDDLVIVADIGGVEGDVLRSWEIVEGDRIVIALPAEEGDGGGGQGPAPG